MPKLIIVKLWTALKVSSDYRILFLILQTIPLSHPYQKTTQVNTVYWKISKFGVSFNQIRKPQRQEDIDGFED